MQSFYIKTSFTISGMIAVSNRTVTADNLINATEDIPAGIAGTAGGAGVMTVATGHGYTNSDVVALFWTAGGVAKARYGCTIVVNSPDTTITVSSGSGDTLPTSGAVVISKVVEVDIAVTGDNMKALFMGGDIAMLVNLEDVGGVELSKTTAANGAYEWDEGGGEANPITGDSIILAHVYNKGTTAGTVTIVVGYDND